MQADPDLLRDIVSHFRGQSCSGLPVPVTRWPVRQRLVGASS